MSATLNAGVVPVYNSPLVWAIKTPNPAIGEVLVVELPMIYGVGSMISIQIAYNTGSVERGLTWLSANQTDGDYPMLFTFS